MLSKVSISSLLQSFTVVVLERERRIIWTIYWQ